MSEELPDLGNGVGQSVDARDIQTHAPSGTGHAPDDPCTMRSAQQTVPREPQRASFFNTAQQPVDILLRATSDGWLSCRRQAALCVGFHAFPAYHMAPGCRESVPTSVFTCPDPPLGIIIPFADVDSHI